MSLLDLWNTLSVWAYQWVSASTFKQANKSTFLFTSFPEVQWLLLLLLNWFIGAKHEQKLFCAPSFIFSTWKQKNLQVLIGHAACMLQNNALQWTVMMLGEVMCCFCSWCVICVKKTKRGVFLPFVSLSPYWNLLLGETTFTSGLIDSAFGHS